MGIVSRVSRIGFEGIRYTAALAAVASAACAFPACGVDETGSAGGGGDDGGPGPSPTSTTPPPPTIPPPVSDAQADAPGDGSASDAGKPCGVDAGGTCPVGAVCASDDDCEGRCTNKVCAAPSHIDGKLSPSLGETDVDCGGGTAPKCLDPKKCVGDGDCASGVCSAAKTCVAGVSCRGTANGPSGIETCGQGEVGDPTAKHESCCRSLPLPVTTTRKLDKYEITTGRIRAFIEAVAAANGGTPNLRAFAKAYAAANPGSQLADVSAGYPGLLDVLPDHAGPTGAVPLPVHLGAFPIDPINALDGCYTSAGAYGHATYWQPPADVGVYGVGAAGVRKYTRETLDTKPMNCVMPLMLATFCAWDGGELARTADFHEVWGRRPVALGATTVFVPWAAIVPWGSFGWRNGHGTTKPFNWPNLPVNPPNFYASPAAGFDATEDDSPAIAAPGRYAADVTAITSANGEGWYDVGGNLMDAAWPTVGVNPGGAAVTGVCDVASSPGPGDVACSRRGNPGVQRYAGALPHVALVGYSFEAHDRRSEAYLASLDGNENRIPAGDLKPVSFQYGKVGGRCARKAP